MTAPRIIAPRIVSLNVGPVRVVAWRGREVATAIWKHPVNGRVSLRGVNFAGDAQADRTVHGGPNKAVYAYATEDYDAWRAAQGIDTPPGLFGENLTTAGIDLSNAVVGTRCGVGTATLEIAQPRMPCFKLGVRMDDAEFPKRFLLARRPGAYFRVVEEGEVGAGDPLVVLDVPAHGVTLRDMVDATADPARARRLRDVPGLPAYWQQVAAG